MTEALLHSAPYATVDARLSQAQAAMNKATQGTIPNGAKDPQAWDAAVQFEAVFLSQMLGPMMETVPTNDLMGGGHAEGIYRGMMVDEIGKVMARTGSIGIADKVYQELIKLQEH